MSAPQPYRLSNSEAKEFKRCRRKWWLRSYRNLVPLREKVAGASSLGTRVHKALELISEGDTAAGLADFHARVNADVHDFPEQEKEIRAEADLALAMIEGYIEWIAEEGGDEDIEVLSNEEVISADLPHHLLTYTPVQLIGKLDQKVRRISTGERSFRDYKTVQDFSRIRLLQMDTQMKHYHLIEMLTLANEGQDRETLEAERAGGAIYEMIRKVKRSARAKPPFFMRHEVRHNFEEMRNYYHSIAAQAHEIIITWNRLDSGESHQTAVPPNPTRDCSWDCDFVAVCPMFDDGSHVEEMLEITYRKGDALARYTEKADDL